MQESTEREHVGREREERGESHFGHSTVRRATSGTHITRGGTASVLPLRQTVVVSDWKSVRRVCISFTAQDSSALTSLFLFRSGVVTVFNCYY